MTGSPKQPKPVDPETVAAAQARWNRTGQITPFGSVTWEGNNQVVNPSEAMMGLFNRATDLANTDSERYQTPGNFGSIRDQVMGRLQANQYQPGAPAAKPAALAQEPAEPPVIAKGGGRETPFRDAFFGERQDDGSRHTLRHIAGGGLMGSIPRGFINLIQEHRNRDKLPGAVGMDSPQNAPIGQNDLGPLLSGMGTGPTKPARGMLGPVALPPMGGPAIERNTSGKPPKPTLTSTRGLGRKPTAHERAVMRRDPSSLLGPQGDPMSPLFTSQTAGLFNAYDLQNSPGAAFDAAVAAARLAQRPNRNIQQ